MAELVGLIAAALQFAEIAVKTIKLARDIYQGAKAGPVRHQITQLETFVEVAQKIADSWTQDDPLTEKILKQCTSTVSDLMGRLERVDVAGSAGLGEKTKKALRARWEKDDIEELFKQLCRDQVALLLHRSFSSDSHLIQKVMDGIRQLIDARLQYSNPENLDERRFLEGIFITDPRDDRSALISRKGHRVEGTCAWVTETDVYRSWLSTAPGPSGLMIQGSPGKGKTMMAIYLTEQLELLSDSGNSVIYFFCDNRNPRQNNALAVIRCLLWQLCRLRPAVLCHGTKELRERGGSIDSLLAFETLWRLFDAMCKDASAGSITCVIDGLDECDDDSVFAIFNKLWRPESNTRFKFLILCRPPTPRQQLPTATANVIRLMLDPDEDGEVNRDVVEFIRQRVQEAANASPKRQWSEELRQHVEATLQEKAGGTFLWVSFVAQDLHRRTSTEVRKYLKSLPADLNEIYGVILKGLPSDIRASIRWLLHWIALAEHPMRLPEFVSLIDCREFSDLSGDTASEPGEESDADSNVEKDKDILRDLIAYVSHFVIVVDDTAYFVHQSAKDYLLRSSRDTDPDLEYFRILDRETAHEKLARLCLDYLHCKLPFINTTEVKSWAFSSGLHDESLKYALYFWPHHIEHSGKALHHPDTTEKIVRLFRLDDLLLQWLQVLGKDVDMGCYPTGHWYRLKTTILSDHACIGTYIGFAIALGLQSVFKQMLDALSVDEYVSAVSSGPHDMNWPLHVALISGEKQYFRHLLEKFGTTAVSREEGILTYVVSHAARISRGHNQFESNHSYLSALLAVTAEARALYGRDLDVALAQAQRMGKQDVTKLLIEKGADPSASGEDISNYLDQKTSHPKRLHTNPHDPFKLAYFLAGNRQFGGAKEQ